VATVTQQGQHAKRTSRAGNRMSQSVNVGKKSSLESNKRAQNKQVTDLKRCEPSSRRRQPARPATAANTTTADESSEEEDRRRRRRGSPQSAAKRRAQAQNGSSSMTRSVSARLPSSTSAAKEQELANGKRYAPEKYADARRKLSESRPGSAPAANKTNQGQARRPAVAGKEAVAASTTVQKHWRGHQARQGDTKVQELKDEVRALRTEEHVRHLTRELQSAKAALEQERKLRSLQMDAIKVLWKEVQMMDAGKVSSSSERQPASRPSGLYGSKVSSRSSEHSIAKLMETLEATAGNVAASSEPDPQVVTKLTETCSSLQQQVEQLQTSITGVMRFVSAVSSSTTNLNSTDASMYASLDPAAFSRPQPSGQDMSKSCDSLVQTDLTALATPKAEDAACKPFLQLKAVDIPVDEASESEASSMAVRPSTLPGLRTLKTLASAAVMRSPAASEEVKSYAKQMVEGLIDQTLGQNEEKDVDETDVSLSLAQDEHHHQQHQQQQQQHPLSPLPDVSSHVETDSLDETNAV